MGFGGTFIDALRIIVEENWEIEIRWNGEILTNTTDTEPGKHPDLKWPDHIIGVGDRGYITYVGKDFILFEPPMDIRAFPMVIPLDSITGVEVKESVMLVSKLQELEISE